MIGVSACLMGIPCRYDGNANEVFWVKNLNKHEIINICPEVLGNLPTPRNPAEIVGGDGFDVWENKAKVVTNDGEDVTNEFKTGAKKALELIQRNNISEVILKEKSPSCGSCSIYNGHFDRSIVKGVGVTAALFRLNGIKVYSEESEIEMTQ